MKQTLARLLAATGSDYVEVRGPGGASPTSAGEKCRTAVDKSSCEQSYASIPATSTYLVPSCGNCAPGGDYLVYTKGDVAGSITTTTQLASWLGTIDDPAEAWTVVWPSQRSIDCSKPWITRRDDGFLVVTTETVSDCPIKRQQVVVLVRRDGTSEVVERGALQESNACIGRRPDGLLPSTAPCARDALGRHFAEAARLEAASVHAFEILKKELRAHGAPRSLLRAVDRARADERRHAKAMAKLARRFGAKVERARVAKRPVRDLFPIAAENLVEGCVNETYGAMEGLFQSQRAEDPEVRAVMHGIARDEIRHAALSWRVAKWLETRLSPAERAKLRALRDEAVQKLAESSARARDISLVESAGVPDAGAASALVAQLRATLWAA